MLSTIAADERLFLVAVYAIDLSSIKIPCKKKDWHSLSNPKTTGRLAVYHAIGRMAELASVRTSPNRTTLKHGSFTCHLLHVPVSVQFLHKASVDVCWVSIYSLLSFVKLNLTTFDLTNFPYES